MVGSLTTTIEHLNEIVKIHTEIDKDKQLLDFEEVFKQVIGALKGNIESLDLFPRDDTAGVYVG